MNAVILAAGKGTRLGTVTEAVPKPMIKIKGKPILQHNIELCGKYGIDHIFINTHHLAEKITDYFGDGSAYGISIQYSYEVDLLGTSGALVNFKDQLFSDPFFVIYGDNLSNYDLQKILHFHNQKSGIGTIALCYLDDVSQSGIAILDENDKIKSFIEKPNPEEMISHFVNAGIYILSPEVFEYIPAGFSDFGKDIFPRLIGEGKSLYGCIVEQPLTVVDTPILYNQAMKNHDLTK